MGGHFAFDLRHARERLVPAHLEFSSYQPVDRIGGVVLAERAIGVDSWAHPTEPRVRPAGVVQQSLRTPTEPIFGKSCTNGIRGSAFRSAFTKHRIARR